jgi:hypothetical protein
MAVMLVVALMKLEISSCAQRRPYFIEYKVVAAAVGKKGVDHGLKPGY